MSSIRTHGVIAALSAALLLASTGAAVAAPPGDDPGDVYADLVIALRDTNGVPVLADFEVDGETGPETQYCVQPISYTAIDGVTSVVNGADGREVWPVPLMGDPGAPPPAEGEEIEVCDPQPAYATFVSEAELERLNLGRVPDGFFDRKLEELEARFDAADTISLDFAGRITTDIIGDVDDDGEPIPPAAIDASPEQQAMYGTLMSTGTVPGLGDAPLVVAGTDDPVAGFDGLDPWMLAAVGLGSGGSKGVSVTVDAVEYYNRIRSIPDMYDAVDPPSSVWNLEFFSNSPADEERFVDLSDFSYDRSKVFPGCGTYLDVPTLTWSIQPIAELAEFSDLPPVATADGIVDNVAGFAQMADDVRAAILFNEVNDKTLHFIDPVGQNTCTEQTLPEVNPGDDLSIELLTVPDKITESADAVFTFSETGSVKTLCSLDAGPLEFCDSPVAYESLSSGDHHFTVLAFAQNGDVADAQYEWTILGELITSSDPVRLVDTRIPWVAADQRFTATGPVVGGTMLEVPIAGRAAIPIGAEAAVMNVTAAGATGRGYLSVYPCGDMPEYSSLNFGTDHPVANELIAELSPNGTVCIFASTTTNVIVDAVGHIPANSAYVPDGPNRLADTRIPWVAADDGFTATGPVVGGTEIEVDIAGRGGIAEDAEAAVMNVTAAGATGRGYLSVYPCGDMPEYSSLNFGTDHPVANELIAELSPDGTVCIFASTTTNVIVDAVGHFPANSAYVPDGPNRLADTRIPWVAADDGFTATGPVVGGTEIEVDIAGRGGIAEDAEAAVMNVTAAGATGRGYLSVYPCGDMPEYSSLNFGTDHPVANELITKLSPDGTVCIFASTTTNVIVDTVGHV